MQPFRLLILYIIITSISGCVSSKDLKESEKKVSKFNTSLAEYYLGFAESEADRYELFDSLYFLNKGSKAAKGKEVLPENFNDWEIPEDQIPTVKQAYKYLTKILKIKDVKYNHPQNAARAQFMYDCWLKSIEESWQGRLQNTCRDNFYKQLDFLFMSISPVKIESPPKMEAKQEIKQPQKTITRSYDINFSHGGAKLHKLAQTALERLKNDLKNKTNYKISLNGYTDKTGKDEANMALSKKRAMTVKEELVKSGIIADKITVFGFGAYDIRVPTKQGQAEPRNRIVEAIVEM